MRSASFWFRGKPGMTHYLYVVCQGIDIDGHGRLSGPCKVGITSNPASRLKGLRTGHPYQLVIYELWDFEDRAFAVAAERMAHVALKDFRLSGEWFDIKPKDAVGRITLWLFWSAEMNAKEKGETEPLPDIPPQGVGMIANGRADRWGRV
jgi:hypothetical protein